MQKRAVKLDYNKPNRTDKKASLNPDYYIFIIEGQMLTNMLAFCY